MSFHCIYPRKEARSLVHLFVNDIDYRICFQKAQLMVSGYSNGLNARFCSHYRKNNDFYQF